MKHNAITDNILCVLTSQNSLVQRKDFLGYIQKYTGIHIKMQQLMWGNKGSAVQYIGLLPGHYPDITQESDIQLSFDHPLIQPFISRLV